MKEFRGYDVFNQQVLYFNHFVYVVIVVILLMNLLIAVFSNSMARVSENKEVMLLLGTIMLSFIIRESLLDNYEIKPILLCVNQLLSNAFKNKK